MSAEPYMHVEQDSAPPPGASDLPTYDDLATQNGPNSRFGRWRGWIEKRAAERYADFTPEERARRRQRGWELENNDQGADSVNAHLTRDSISQSQAPAEAAVPLHIQTSSLSLDDETASSEFSAAGHTPLPFVSQSIEPTHLRINHFGSRFLPHTTSQIRCVLPLLGNRMLLVGHDEGMSVLDMFPTEWTESGQIKTNGPDEAVCRVMWRGDAVYQMSVLEAEDPGNGTPQGVVLAVVGPSQDSCSSKDSETRVARMYNLASLISLARWAIANKGGKPVELSTWQTAGTPMKESKRHRAQGSIARGIKSFIESPVPTLHVDPHANTYLAPTLPAASGSSPSRPHPSMEPIPSMRSNSDDSTWSVVDELPLRWATDFVPLAVAGSRLVGASVVAFATWSDETRRDRTGGQLLAIATKSNILLYETPKGERAYKFVKEFYTPIQPRQLMFIQQVVDTRSPDAPPTSPSKFTHKRSDSGSKGLPTTSSSATLTWGTHLSLFVVFDKKAGLIRLADSAVGEAELGDDVALLPQGNIVPRDTFSSTISAHSLRQKARVSLDIRESGAKWNVPVRCYLPIPGQYNQSREVIIMTRGRRTHIVPCPLPSRPGNQPPLHAVFWKSQPKYVSPRVLISDGDEIDEPPLLQLVAFGENGIEVQELGLSFLSLKGKGRLVAPDENMRAAEDLGEAGFLTTGGNWDRMQEIYGSMSMHRTSSFMSGESMDSVDLLARMKREEGIYGWCRKGLADWRIFWVGGNRDLGDLDEEGLDPVYN
ncbi:hypothetical protein D9619_000583 [Psilocybe cf. subviscida]|uniref:Uncharacterized protein n=1 Tax=Psilocybe cf. subviscida TaxID=2480587 RepID=A0A8H5BFY9_9AGAR|nr:hypothetical protein D9619_000583 [Psilocybe cf. subviscida]